MAMVNGLGLPGVNGEDLTSFFQSQSPLQALAHVQKLRFCQQQQQLQLQLQQQQAAASASLAFQQRFAASPLANAAHVDADVTGTTHALENSLTTSPTGSNVSASGESDERTPEAKSRRVTSSRSHDVDTSPTSSDDRVASSVTSPPVFPGLPPDAMTSSNKHADDKHAMTSSIAQNPLLANQMAAFAAHQSLQLIAASQQDPVSMAMLGEWSSF